MKLFACLAGACLLAACAADPRIREAREYQEAEWRSQLAEDNRRCQANGGRLVIKTGMARLGRRSGIKPGDTYSCDMSMALRRL